MKKFKILLSLSLLLNILFIGSGSYVVNKMGGIDFVTAEVQASPSVKKDANYYFTKKSVFDNSTVQQPDKVFIGDSITDYGEFPEYFPGEVVMNRGIRNDTAEGVLERVEEVVERDPKKVYLMIGVNDIRHSTDIQDFKKKVTAIVNAFDGTGTELFVQSILPVNNQLLRKKVSNEKVKEFNDILQKIARENGIEYIDLHIHFKDESEQLDERYTIDGLHLNGEGYRLWVALLNKLNAI